MSTSNSKQRKSRKVDFVLCLQLPSGKNVCSRLAHMKRCVLPSSQSNLAVKTRCLCYSPRKELSLLLCHRSPKARKRTNGYQKMVQTCYTDGSRKLDTFPEIFHIVASIQGFTPTSCRVSGQDQEEMGKPKVQAFFKNCLLLDKHGYIILLNSCYEMWHGIAL